MRQNPRMRHCEPVKNSSCLEIKAVLKMCQNCFFLIKVDFKLTWNQGKIHELPWNQSCFQNAPELFFEIKFKIHLDFRGEKHVLPWNQGCFQNVREPAFHNHYNSNKWSGREMMGNWSSPDVLFLTSSLHSNIALVEVVGKWSAWNF